jgi:formylglycine-generating enzyme required for sulfatase activity
MAYATKRDLDPFALIQRLPDPAGLDVAEAPEHRERLRRLRTALHDFEPSAHQVAEFCGVAALHPDPWVRREMLTALPQWRALGQNELAEAVAWAIHDTDDFVAFAAITLAGELRLRAVLPHLVMIVGRASERLRRQAGKPVGMGHALVLRAITDVAGTSDPDELEKVERTLFEGDHPFPTSYLPPDGHRDGAAAGTDRADMVRIPAGSVTFGVPPALASEGLTFDWSDVADPWVEELETFWIDRFQVSAGDYDRFATSAAARTHAYCHPSEPPDKLHVRNTLLDDRFGPDSPATGVDWFDAYAYAHAHGKRLPSEGEWQRAAQGDDARAFPWGDEFEPKKAQWVGTVLGTDAPGLRSWQEQLVHMGHDNHHSLTAPVAEGSSASTYGVVGMAGNAWEWSATNFYSRYPLEPEVGDRDSLDVVYDWRSYPVIRGGSWSSLPELTSAAFRGRDLLTDRHFENGFRCAAS